jgi:hypothetical protein
MLTQVRHWTGPYFEPAEYDVTCSWIRGCACRLFRAGILLGLLFDNFAFISNLNTFISISILMHVVSSHCWYCAILYSKL